MTKNPGSWTDVALVVASKTLKIDFYKAQKLKEILEDIDQGTIHILRKHLWGYGVRNSILLHSGLNPA